MINDLTMNEDFSKRRRGSITINDIFINNRFIDDSDPTDEVIFTGNAEIRDLKRYYIYNTNKNSNEKFCDRCGKRITIKPWAKHDTLCEECNTELENEIKESQSEGSSLSITPWSNLNIELIGDANRVFLYD